MTPPTSKVSSKNPAKPSKKTATPYGTCPICKAPATLDYPPFCSKRCADIDLGRWFNGNYRIPTDNTPSSDEGF